MFHVDRTKFAIILRHPIGAGHVSERIPRGIVSDCGTVYLEHWLRIHEALERDIAHLNNAVVVMYEHFQMGDSQGIFDAIQKSLDLKPSVRLQFSEYKLGGEYEIVETPWRKKNQPDLEQERALIAAGSYQSGSLWSSEDRGPMQPCSRILSISGCITGRITPSCMQTTAPPCTPCTRRE